MSEIRKQRCLGCMSELSGDEICLSCDYSTSKHVKDEDALPLGTLLADGRYLVGEAKHKNGQGFTYIGYDYTNNIKVNISEFFPSDLAERLKNEDEVISKTNTLTQFKTSKVDFSDIQMTLMNMENKRGLFPTIDCFEQNNTIYSISQVFESIPLSTLLQDNETLSTQQALAIFDPLLHTISRLHQNNLVHRGISPETIYIDLGGELRLGGFAISSVRTVGSELQTEIFSGYTAPEQYTVTQLQGTWTDVYAISAVLYRALSGQVPIPADKRQTRKLAPIASAVKDLPDEVIYTITQGLHLKPEDRIQNMDIYIEFLHYGPEAKENAGSTKLMDVSDTAQTPKTPKQNESRRKKRKSGRAPLLILSIILTAIACIILAFLAIRSMNNFLPEEESSDPEISEQVVDQSELSQNTEYTIPRLEGKFLEAITKDKDHNVKFVLQMTHEYHEMFAKDVIALQEPEAGSVVNIENGPVEIKVVISKGPVELPDMENMTIDEAKEILENASEGSEEKVLYKINEQFSANIEAGKVIRVQRGGKELILVVSKGENPNAVQMSEEEEQQESSGNYWDNW